MTQRDLDSLFALARSEATTEAAEARDSVLEELQAELRSSVPKQLTKKFGLNHRFEADEYIQHILGKVLEDWGRPSKNQQFWSKLAFKDLVSYAHVSCIHQAYDSQRALGRRAENGRTGGALHVRERRRESQDRGNLPNTLHPQVKHHKKVEDIRRALDEGVARGELTPEQRGVLLAREYRDPRPTRGEVMKEFGLASEDAVTDLVGKTKLWVRDQFKDWGPGGETVKD